MIERNASRFRDATVECDYRVTKQLEPNLMLTGGMSQAAWSPCTLTHSHMSLLYLLFDRGEGPNHRLIDAGNGMGCEDERGRETMVARWL